jgi:UDP-glucuronate decarboxylase
MSKRILISGGGGFIGSHLTDRLIAQGHHVVAVDNFFSSQRENVEHLANNPNFTLIEHDVVNPLLHLEAIGKVDQVYHLACPASPIYYQHDAIKTVKTNVLGTINLLDVAEKNNARFLISSTSEIYGDPLVHPQKEDYWGNVSTLGPRACYDEGKRVAETLTMEYHRQKGLDTRIVRIFNTYGPRMKSNDGRVISNFITQALTGDSITVYGDGSQTRSFCFVDDTVEGIIRLMNSETSGPYPVNMGNPEEVTVLELAQRIGILLLGEEKIVFKSLPKDDPTRRKPDITRAKEVLGWGPTIPLDVGLHRAVDYFREVQKNGRLEKQSIVPK